MSRPLRRSYFDLLKEKYPDSEELGPAPRWAGVPAAAGPPPSRRIAAAVAADRLVSPRSGVPAAASRQGRRLLAVVLSLLAASLLILFLGPQQISPPTPQGALQAVEPQAEARATEVPALEPLAVAPKAVAPPVAAPRTAELRAAEPRVAAPRTAEPGPVEQRPSIARAEQTPATAGRAAATAGSVEGTPAERQTAERRDQTATGVTVFAPQPEYPAAARRAGLEGSVWVEAGVDGSGRVSDVRVVEGSSPELDRAAVEALRQWRFEPTIRDGRPLAYRYRQQFRFALELERRTAARRTAARRTAEVPQTLPDGDEVTPPVKLATPLPGYTPAAWAAGIQGDVMLKATIDERGEVTAVEVVRGLPHGLTEAAVAAVRRWKFRPATRGGEPVAVEHLLSLRFAL